MKSLVPVGKFLSGYGFSSAPLTLILGQLGSLGFAEGRYVASQGDTEEVAGL